MMKLPALFPSRASGATRHANIPKQTVLHAAC
jgi:hypothetical protein